MTSNPMQQKSFPLGSLPTRELLLLTIAGLALAVLAGCAEGAAVPALPLSNSRIVFPNATINHQSAAFIMDTGAGSAVLFGGNAGRFKIQYLPSAPVSIPGQFSEQPLRLSGPVEVTVGDQSFNLPFQVYDAAFHQEDGIIGWPELRDNPILYFDSDHQTVSRLEQLPAASASWLKVKIRPGDDLAFDIPLTNGRTGTIIVDTGSDTGLALTPGYWQDWKTAHPQARLYSGSWDGLGANGSQILSEAWTDEFKLGTLSLTDLPLRQTSDFEGTLFHNFYVARADYIGTLGLYGLRRVELIVDQSNGFAYLHPLPPPGPPYAQFPRPGIKEDPLAKANWTMAENVRVKLDPPYLLAGKIMFAQGDFRGAIQDYSDSVALNPQRSEAYVGRAVAEAATHNLDDAIADCNHALELDPNRIDAYADRGAAESEKGDYSHAIADINHALALDPSDGYYYRLTRGTAEIGQGDIASAISDFTHIIGNHPKRTPAYEWRGTARQIQGDFAGAISDYDQSITLTPEDSAEIALYRQVLLRRLGKPTGNFAQIVTAWKDGWPKSLGLFLTGTLNEAGLLAAANHGNSDDTPGQQEDALYFIGITHLLNGDPSGARDAWNKCAALPGRDITSSELARAELARLDKDASK